MLIYTNNLWKLYGDLENVKKVMEEMDDDGRTADDFTDDEAYSFAYQEMDDEWDNLMENIRMLDKKSPSCWVVTADLELWDGHHAGGKIFQKLEDAIYGMVSKMDYITIEESAYGNVELFCSHHDGTNRFVIRRLNSTGEYAYLHSSVFDDPRTVVERLRKPKYSSNARLMSAFGWR